MIGIIIGGLAVGFGVIMIALLRMAKQTDIDSGIEPSLGQEDKIVVIDDLLCHSIPQNHCNKYHNCEQCQEDWLRGMEAKNDR